MIPEDSMIQKLQKIPPQEQEAMISEGLKMIAQGQVSIVIECLDPSVSIKLKEPQVTKWLSLPIPKCVLEIIIQRIQSLGKLAVEKHGKLY